MSNTVNSNAGDIQNCPSWVASNFAILEQSLNGASASPAHVIRKNALANLLKSGLPTAELEEWKYSNLQAFVGDKLKVASRVASDSTQVDLSQFPVLDNANPIRIVFIDGFIQAIPKVDVSGVRIESLSELLKANSRSGLSGLGVSLPAQKNVMAALNTAFLQDGLVLTLDEGVVLETVIEVINFSTQPSSLRCPRILVRANKNSQVTLIESHLGQVDGLTCALTEIQAEENAVVKHYRLQNESLDNVHVGLLGMSLAKNANVATSSYNFGSKFTRNEVHAALGGEYVNCDLFGLTAIAGKQHVDNTTVLDHQLPHGQSRENYKGVYSEKARGVFSGTIIVQPDAQKTNAIQSNKSVLLSDEARIDTRPQLKIWADDVKCTHGATVGQLSEEELFYLRARGIDKAEAERILVKAFCEEIFSEIQNTQLNPFKDYLSQLLVQAIR